MAFVFKKYSLGGSGGSGGFIEVDQFPTEDVDTGSVYKTSETISSEPQAYVVYPEGIPTCEEYFKMDAGIAVNIPIYVVESLPDVMESVNADTFTAPCYVIESTGIGYISEDGNPANVITLGKFVIGTADFDKGWADSVDSLHSLDLSEQNNWGIYCVRGEDRTAISYGVPGNADLRSIKEYTTEDGWKTIINRVDSFPTKNVEDEAVYQIRKEVDELLDVWFVLDGMFSGNLVDMGRLQGVPITATYYLVDELPESPIVSTLNSSSRTADLHVYIIRDTGEPFVLMNAGGVCESLGEVMFGGLSFNGIISDSADATADGVYTIMREAGVMLSYGIPNADGKKKVYEQSSDGTWVNPGAETARLKVENETLTNANETLTNANAALETENRTLANAKTALEAEKETLTSEKATLEAENETLTSEKVTLEAEKETLTTAKATLEAENTKFGMFCTDETELNFVRYAILDASTLVGISDKNITDIVIPDGVTSIGDSAFSGCSSLTSIIIPDGVTSIGDSAFSGCSSLTSIIIPDGVTSIGDSAFSGCSSLTSIIIPDGVTEIKSTIFSGCSSLASVTIPDSVTSIEANSFADCNDSVLNEYEGAYYVGSSENPYSHLIGVKDSTITVCVLHEDLLCVCDSAFSGCSSLTSVTIPDSVTSIGDYAFKGCSGLTEIIIPDGVTSIGNNAFEGCSGLTNITIPDGVTSIGNWTFFRCSDLTSITIPDSVTSIGDRAFGGCSGLTEIIIPDGVTSIGDGAFSGCSSLTEIIIPDGVTSIGDSAFSSCSSLTSIIIPDGVTSIGYAAFNGCSSLTSVTIPDGVTSIGSSAFDGCSSLTSVAIPDGVTSIGENAFRDCTGISMDNLVLPANLTKLGQQAFLNCSGITGNITIPGGLQLGYSCFSGCSGLTSVTLQDGVDEIVGSMFHNCAGLTSVTIPDGVTSIGNGAFSGCSSLTEIIIPDGVTSIGNSAFEGCSGLTSVVIPDSVTNIGLGEYGSQHAFYGCSGLTSITVEDGNRVYHSAGDCLIKTKSKTLILGCNNSVIPADDSVTSIGDGAFKGCSGLTEIIIPDSVTSIGHNAFYGCSGLTSITVEDGNSVYHSAGDCLIETKSKTLILGCSNSVIPADDSVTSIGNYAFEGCSGLTEIIIPDGVTSIGDNAFEGCSGLTSVVAGTGLETIYTYAFAGCSSLTGITFRSAFGSYGYLWIQNFAFYNCRAMQYLDFTAYISSRPPVLQTNTLISIPSTCEIRVPAALYDNWIKREYWSSYANQIVAV